MHNSWKKAQVVVQYYAFGSLGDLDLPCIALFYEARLLQFHYWLTMSDQSYSMKAFYYPKITQLTHHSRSWIKKKLTHQWNSYGCAGISRLKWLTPEREKWLYYFLYIQYHQGLCTAMRLIVPFIIGIYAWKGGHMYHQLMAVTLTNI